MSPAPNGPSTPSLAPGRRVARKYDVIRQLGGGHQGTVFHVVHHLTGRAFALKWMDPLAVGDLQASKRFLREAQAACAIRHPNVVDVLDVDVEGQGLFLVMELLEGESLKDRLRRGPIPPDELLRLLVPALEGLHQVHEQGIVHRDLKPANIMVARDPSGAPERAVLVDFGVAKALGAGRATIDPLTETGTVLGTPLYMAPEQIGDSSRVDRRADVYAMGVILYEALAGRLPLTGESVYEHLLKVIRTEPPHLRTTAPRVPGPIADAVMAALAKDLDARLPTARALADALRSGMRRPADGDGAESGAASGGRDGLGAAPQREGGRRGRAGIVVAVVAAALLALGSALAVWAVAPSFEPRAPAEGAATPPGTEPVDPVASDRARVAGRRATLGSTPEERADAHRACVAAASASECPASLFARESLRDVEVATFDLERTEVSAGDFARWLAGRQPRLEAPGEAPALLVDPDGVPLAFAATAEQTFSPVVVVDGVPRARPGREGDPAVLLTWYAAVRYCAGRGGRLPSADEWELAARGAGRRRLPWGDDDVACGEAVFARRPGQECAGRPDRPAPVLADPGRDVTPSGLAALGGNVGEWVGDRAPCPEAQGQDGQTGCRVWKGGDYRSPRERLRSAAANAGRPDGVFVTVGFRCAYDVPRRHESPP
ncbi:MAG: bifunctional serine/threonine-protein kinase/formylglycine-generating enzyme family protein [Sandaracinaceae bacterium]